MPEPKIKHILRPCDRVQREFLLEDADWLVDHYSLCCPANFPSHLGPRWLANPTPIDVLLSTPPVGLLPPLGDAHTTIIHESLYELLAEHMKHFLIGTVSLRSRSRTKRVPYVSCNVYPKLKIDIHRFKEAAHFQCPGCGIIETPFWNKECVPRSSLGDRLVHGTVLGPYMNDTLAKALKLQRRFPELAFRKCKVVPSPLDGDVLPEDRGWDGVFRTQWDKLKFHLPDLKKLYGLKVPRTSGSTLSDKHPPNKTGPIRKPRGG